jgi:hypothetical protein
MANISLQQTDSGAIDGAESACSSAGATSVTDNKKATQGGTPGTTTPTISLSGNQTNSRGIHFESAANEPGQTSWPAGNWVVRLNITTANANITWTGTYICRVNSSGQSLATVGSLTGQSLGLGSTGVQSMTISGSAQSANVTDRIYIVLVFSNSQTSLQSFNYQPNQFIDTPIPALPLFVFTKKPKRAKAPGPKKRRRDHSWMHHPLMSPPLWPFSQSRAFKKSLRRPSKKWLSKKSGTVHLISAFRKLCGHTLIQEDLRATGLISESLASLLTKSKETTEAILAALSATVTVVESIGKTGSNLGIKGTSAKVIEVYSATATLECCK